MIPKGLRIFYICIAVFVSLLILLGCVVIGVVSVRKQSDCTVAPRAPSLNKVTQVFLQTDRKANGKQPLILPCELTNGGLPLLMVRIVGSPPTKVVLDTASDYLLIADLHKCKKCSIDMYGGARSDRDQEEGAPHVKVYFGSQVDKVQFQTRDIQLGDFAVVQDVSVGVVVARETRVDNNTHTFNILGIGAMGMATSTYGQSMIEQLLRRYDQPMAFGFYFSSGLRNGLFVLGYAVQKTNPVLTIPMYPHPSNPYYLLKIAAIDIIDTNDKKVHIDNIRGRLPEALADTGANFMALPTSLEPYFNQTIKEVVFYFRAPDGHQILRIPQSNLYGRGGQKRFYFAEDRCVIGTFVMSQFSYVEFDFEQSPVLRLWE